MEALDKYCEDCDIVFNCSGLNRPNDSKKIKEGNFGFASDFLNMLKKRNNKATVMLNSSFQATLQRYFGTPEYDISKKAGEELFFSYAKEIGAKVICILFS